MSYNLFIDCSVWNFSSESRNNFIDLLKKEGYKQGKDFEVTESLNVNLINFRTVLGILKLAEYRQERDWKKQEENLK